MNDVRVNVSMKQETKAGYSKLNRLSVHTRTNSDLRGHTLRLLLFSSLSPPVVSLYGKKSHFCLTSQEINHLTTKCTPPSKQACTQ